jgi:hypothetical protein
MVNERLLSTGGRAVERQPQHNQNCANARSVFYAMTEMDLPAFWCDNLIHDIDNVSQHLVIAAGLAVEG